MKLIELTTKVQVVPTNILNICRNKWNISKPGTSVNWLDLQACCHANTEDIENTTHTTRALTRRLLSRFKPQSLLAVWESPGFIQLKPTEGNMRFCVLCFQEYRFNDTIDDSVIQVKVSARSRRHKERFWKR